MSIELIFRDHLKRILMAYGVEGSSIVTYVDEKHPEGTVIVFDISFNADHVGRLRLPLAYHVTEYITGICDIHEKPGDHTIRGFYQLIGPKEPIPGEHCTDSGILPAWVTEPDVKPHLAHLCVSDGGQRGYWYAICGEGLRDTNLHRIAAGNIKCPACLYRVDMIRGGRLS